MSAPDKHPSDEDPIRPHTYDGIQEYDKQLPNWWLFTLYITIAFSVVYWFYYEIAGVGRSSHAVFRTEMEEVQAARLANAVEVDDPTLWEMSRNSRVVSSGQEIFTQNCVQCHLASLRGKSETPTAVGPDLLDDEWVHGGRPVELRQTVAQGVLDKGMPQWGPVLGDKKIVEVVAYILNHHEPPPAESGN